MLGQLEEKRIFFLGLGGREVGLSFLWVPSGSWEDRVGCHSRKLGSLATWVWCDQSQLPFILTLDLSNCDV